MTRGAEGDVDRLDVNSPDYFDTLAMTTTTRHCEERSDAAIHGFSFYLFFLLLLVKLYIYLFL